MSDDPAEPPLLAVNSVENDMTRTDYRVVPAVADAEAQVQSLPDIAKQNENLIAGINGGYFWRVDIDGFWRDNVCRGKTRDEAESPADQSIPPQHPNYGVGDGLVRVDGQVYSNNCDCYGNSRPAVLKLNGTDSYIDVLYRGETVDESVLNAIGAGPNLVSFNAETGESYIDIPADDDNINRFVYEATAAVGLQLSQSSPSTVSADVLVMVTTDGSDSCLPGETYCGLVSPNLASLMREVFDCGVAMSMDQGGSTTMWIQGENPDRDGVVSRSDNKSPTEGARSLANGLFLELLV